MFMSVSILTLAAAIAALNHHNSSTLGLELATLADQLLQVNGTMASIATSAHFLALLTLLNLGHVLADLQIGTLGQKEVSVW
jgi:hypothetical protein